MLSLNVPGVWTRHYAFLDFKKFGYNWRPNYINFVRNPIEKVNIFSAAKIRIFRQILSRTSRAQNTHSGAAKKNLLFYKKLKKAFFLKQTLKKAFLYKKP